MKKRKFLVIIFIIFTIFSNVICYGNENNNTESNNQNENLDINDVNEKVKENANFDEYIKAIDDELKKNNIDDIDIYDMSNSLLEDGSIDFNNLFFKILGLFSKEFKNVINSAVIIFIIVLVMSVLSSFELEKGSQILNIANLVCFFTLATIIIKSFIEIIEVFKNTITSLTTLMQIVSPFLMAILISTGAISTTGIIKPLVLFIASAVGFIINYIVVPFISISASLKIINNFSDNIKIGKMSSLFSSSALWIVSISFTIFLGILSLETTISSSVDSLAVKTMQNAVSNFVPVVGKFFSDSFETVVGATKVISNVSGVIGIITIVTIAIIPVLKILCVYLLYQILSAIIEPICNNKTLSNFISDFAGLYKLLLGILIGVSILFVISSGIILNLVSSVVK